MNTPDLIDALRARAADPDRRTDFSRHRPIELGAPASPAELAQVRSELGFPLHPLHQLVLSSVGNGGFGPGNGLIGTLGGVWNEACGHLSAARAVLCLPRMMPAPVVPLCHWYGPFWACLDSRSGRVLTLSGLELWCTCWALHEWLAAWALGVSPDEQMTLLRAYWTNEPEGVRGFQYLAPEVLS